jgi:hypothetical protein
MHRFRALALLTLSAVITVGAAPPPANTMFWGEAGHRLIGRAAALAAPAQMPEFFRQAVAQLEYLNPEPDRWRDRRESAIDPAMDHAFAPEHFIDSELVPPGALEAPGRLAFLDSLRKAGQSGSVTGLLPYRILEMAQTLRVEFRLWRDAKDEATRRFIEQRIINDAGVMGHYVADGSNPHHTTIHFNGWSATAANPKGFTTERNFHSRFESQYVETHMTIADVQPLVARDARVVASLRDGILAHIDQSHALVERLYELDKGQAFGPATTSADHKRFTAERLAAGATMLRDLWWTAWVTSEGPPR